MSLFEKQVNDVLGRLPSFGPWTSVVVDLGKVGPVEEMPDSSVTHSQCDESSDNSHDKPDIMDRKRALELALPEAKQQRTRKSINPSKYCHGCGNLPRSDKVVCSNLKLGTCRKIFCRSCVVKIYGKWSDEHVSQDWTCTHCQGTCPSNAACVYYQKRNSQRPTRSRSPH